MEVKCLQCGSSFRTFPSRLKRGEGKFCSRACNAKYHYRRRGTLGEYTEERTAKSVNTKRERLREKYPLLFDTEYMETRYLEMDYSMSEIAQEIGCSFTAVRNRISEMGLEVRSIKDIKSTDRYLDKYRGENNTNWLGGKSNYKGRDWNARKKEAIERDKNTCQRCGVVGEGKNLDVHHRIPYRFSHNNDLENLVTLCSRCHKVEEWEWLRAIKEDKDFYSKLCEMVDTTDKRIKDVDEEKLISYYKEGKSFKEIGELLGITGQTAKRKLERLGEI